MNNHEIPSGALGFALLSFLVAFLMLDGTMSSGAATATVLPASLMMFAVVLRHRRATAA